MDASVMDTRPDLVIMLLAGGVNGPLTGIVIDRLTGGIVDIRVDALTEVCTTVVVVDSLIDALVRTVNGVLADMWVVVMTFLEFVTFPVSLEELFSSCLTACRCCPISAILNCRVLQAWIPPCHVC